MLEITLKSFILVDKMPISIFVLPISIAKINSYSLKSGTEFNIHFNLNILKIFVFVTFFNTEYTETTEK